MGEGNTRLCDSVDIMSTQRAGAETTREEVVNVILAELLRERGLAARAERRSRRESPDIRVSLPSRDQLIVECKWETSRRDLERQLDERLTEFPDAIAVIGVLYPSRLRLAEDTRGALESADDLQWWVHGSRGQPRPLVQRRRGAVPDFGNHLAAVPLEFDEIDRVIGAASTVGSAVEIAAGQIRGHARVSSRIAKIIAESDQESNELAAVKIASLVLFNALAFQERLSAIDPRVPTPSETLRGGITRLRESWLGISETIDYVPVFELATNILEELENAPLQTRRAAVDILLWAVGETRSLEGHDLSGRLFHTLLSDAKYKGAYYTSVPAAAMLAHLVFDNWPPQIDWTDSTFPSLLSVADLACGTGTLLMAVASEVERRHQHAGGKDRDALHKNMVEFALHGYDVQLSAIHFAATSLAMLNPKIEFDHMNLWVMPLGVDNGVVSLGSLDFLVDRNETPAQFVLSPTMRPDSARQVSARGTSETDQGMARLPTLDLAIMNPPFTRSVGGNLLFGSLPAEQRRATQDELSRRLKTVSASATAGLGAAFVATAAGRLRHGEGRLALVLPVSVTTGPSWSQTRELIERDFHLDMVITSHDPHRWNFSDSTDLSEVLLIATRRPDTSRTPKAESDDHRTTFVNLWTNPETLIDAQRTAAVVAAMEPAELEGTGTTLLELDGRHVGEVVSVRQDSFQGDKWPGVQFARADVTRSAMRLLSNGEVWVPGGGLASIPLCEIQDLVTLGPDQRRLVDGFTRTDTITAYPMVENHDTETRRTIATDPNKYLAPLTVPKGGQTPGYGERLWQQAGQLLLAERLRVNTARVVSMYASERVLSNVWWPIRNGDPRRDKALAAYLNSTLGILALLATRNTTQSSWVKLKKADLQRLPVLDVRALSEEKLDALSALFDVVSEMEFERLPAMAECPARRALDDGLSRILNLPDLEPLRRLLATEPVVSNRRL